MYDLPLGFQVIVPIWVEFLQSPKTGGRVDQLATTARWLEAVIRDEGGVSFITDGGALGLTDYVRRAKEDQFLVVSFPDQEYRIAAEGLEQAFTIKERVVYFDYGLFYLDLMLYPRATQDHVISTEFLEGIHAQIVADKEALRFRSLALLSAVNSSTKVYIGLSFSISVICDYRALDDKLAYNVSREYCGEFCSGTTLEQFQDNSFGPVHVNHGFTGNFIFFSQSVVEEVVRAVLGINAYVCFISSAVPEFTFIVSRAISGYGRSGMDSVAGAKSELGRLSVILHAGNGLVFDSYPENVNTTKLDAVIYEKAFDVWEFEKYIAILREQLSRLGGVIGEINAFLNEKNAERTNWILKIISVLAVTSVVSDVLKQMDIHLGYYYAAVPLAIVLLAILLMRKER